MGFKKIIAVGLIATTIVGVMLSQNIKNAIKKLQSVKIVPTSLRDFDAKFNDFKPFVSFKLNILLFNPLNEAIQVNGYIAKLQRIIIKDKKGNVLGVSTPNIGKISIPAKASYTLPNVPFSLDIQTLAINLINYKTITKDSFQFEVIISVAGAEYKLKQ